MRAHIKSYATRTSAHGCAYLSLHSSQLPLSKLLWFAAILMSFLTSGYVLWSSIKEVDENPISTTLEYIPVQEIPFPSVTINTELLGLVPSVHFRLLKELKEQFRVDCRESQVHDDLDSCINRTRALRLLFKPAVKAMLMLMHTNFIDFLGRSKSTESTYIENEICSFTGSFFPDQNNFRDGLYTILEFLSASSRPADHLEVAYDVLAENFKLPLETFFSDISETLDMANFTFQPSQPWNCAVRYQTMTLEAKALGAVLVTMFHDKSGLSLTSFDDLVSAVKHLIPSNSTFWQDYSNVHATLEECSKNPFRHWDFWPWHFIEYLEWHSGSSGTGSFMAFSGCNFEAGGCAGGYLCCYLRDYVQESYSKVLATYNLFLQPLGPKPRYLREEEYMDKMLTCPGINAAGYDSVPRESFRFASSALVACEFHTPGSHCQDMFKTYTTEFPSHTFNSANFFEIYHKSAVMDAFCQEEVQVKNYNACTSAMREIAKVDENGKYNGLSLLMHKPLVHDKSTSINQITIHSAYSIPDSHSTSIHIVPGFYHFIEVTPRVTTTDENLLKKEQAVRNCHAEGIDTNPLRVFKHYSRENCIFECKVLATRSSCGCVHWKFPREDGDAVCAKADGDCFINFFYNTNINKLDCTHCRDECTRVDYGYGRKKYIIMHEKHKKYKYKIHLLPLDNMCMIFPHYKSLIDRFVGIHGYDLLMQRDLDKIDLDGAIKNKCHSYAKKHMAPLFVYVGPPRAIKIIRRLRVTFLQQVANLGGMVALFTGMSILSVFELLMWLLEIPWVLKWTTIKERLFFKSKVQETLPKITTE